MSKVDGGRVAARGFQYQYLRTLEALLDALADGGVSAVRVEGPPSGTDGGDVVDFDVLDPEGRVLTGVQVKSRGPGATMSAAELFGLLADMVADDRRHDYDADGYLLLTNAAPTPGAVQLVEALAEDDAAEPAVRRRLRDVLHDAPARLDRLSTLTSPELARLARATALFDGRDTYQLRVELRERMRQFRQQIQPGLGMKSAGLLAGYLMSEIFNRAASPDGTFTVAEFRNQLLSNDSALSLLLGYRDWGAVVGPIAAIADVPRPALLTHVAATLDTPMDHRVVSRTLLVGPSGIGKSSLAAAVVADTADNYDMIFWIDAESDQSLTLGLRQVFAALNGQPLSQIVGLDQRELIGEVHAALSRFPGRWLMVFDDVRSARRIERWLPATGAGRVLITSLDASANWGTATVVEVGPMELPEATSLLAARLGVTASHDIETERLELLAEKMERWPLALELAAGYMVTCGIALSAVDRYLDQVAVLAVDDENALPPRYPRTLAAAIHLSLAALQAKAGEDIVHDLAMGMIIFAAYVGSRQIPVHLITAAVAFQIVEADTPDVTNGPVVLDPTIARPLEAVRELRHFSLVTLDVPLPATGDELLPDANETLTLNSIVQDVVRAYALQRADVAAILRVLAHHLGRWLLGSAGLGFPDRLAVIAAHADIIMRHITRHNVQDPDIALMLGNLAGAHRLQGDVRQAVRLLRQELEVLSGTDLEIRGVQAQLSLASMFLLDEAGDAVSEDEAIQWLESVYFFTGSILADYPNAASKLSSDALRVLGERTRTVVDQQAFIRLEAAFGDLHARVPFSPYTQAINLVREAGRLLSAGDDQDAESVLRLALSYDSLGENVIEAERLLLEALARQDKFPNAGRLFDQITARLGVSGMLNKPAADLIHNTGLACAPKALLGSTAAHRLLTTVLAWPARTRIAAGQDPVWHARIQLLDAVDALCTRGIQRDHVQTFVSAMSGLDLGSDAAAEGWRMLRDLPRLVVSGNIGLRLARPA